MRVVQVGSEDTRTAAMAACMERLFGLDGQKDEDAGQVTERVKTLRSSARLFFEEGEGTVVYAPSTEAKTALFGEGETSNWPAKVERHMKEVRQIPGALFRFPVVNTEEVLAAFITDWSPFPAAASLAVHPSHPLAEKCDYEAERFTGHYVRHVLTGDLLPVWTASWVRPEFGSGAVIVNPAHSEIDLEFAREVGLPIKFGLGPEGPPSSDPVTWLDPPLIKQGVAIRTGIADGAGVEDARQKYLSQLEDAGHATPYTDRVLPLLEFGAASDSSIADIALKEGPRQVLSAPLEASDVIVCSAGNLDALACLRALHLDLYGHDIVDADLILVQPATGDNGKDEASPEHDLALIGFGKADEVLTLKEPQIEQIQRFFENHAKLERPADEAPEKPPKRVARILEQVGAGETGVAFAELYKLQRDLRKKPESVGAGDRFGYFAAAHVIAGLAPPEGYPLTDLLPKVS